MKEKVLGAHRAGITTIILPKDNEADMEDIPEEVRNQLTFHCVSTLDEVFEIALMPAGERNAAGSQADAHGGGGAERRRSDGWASEPAHRSGDGGYRAWRPEVLAVRPSDAPRASARGI